MLDFFKRKKEPPQVDESKIDINIRKDIKKTFIKKHVMNDKAVNTIVNIFKKYPQELIVVNNFSKEPVYNKESYKINLEDIKNLTFAEQISCNDSLMLIYDKDYKPLVYWDIIGGNIYNHPNFHDIEIQEDIFELTENYLWESFNTDVKKVIFFIDTEIRGYKALSWSASWDSYEFFDLVETFNITGAILSEGSEETNDLLEKYKVKHEKYNGFILINGIINPEFLMKFYNLNGNQGTICEMALFVDMNEPITREMVKGKYIDIKDNKVILPLDDYADTLCFFNF
ncbi:hypothetical protein ACMGE5_01040 [Macrococcus equi]|uniref:hypothetical protein n=1 Tax=Macrococcus equi TaxID=3395462 RepID=UPI0039BECD2C